MKEYIAQLIGKIIFAVVMTVLTSWLSARVCPTRDFMRDGSPKDASVTGILTHPQDICFDDVRGLARAKQLARCHVVLPLKHCKLLLSPETPPSMRPPRNMLFAGPPGTGKTMLARAMASEASVPLISIHASVVQSKWWGESPKLLANAFALARTKAPCIIFFDEVDALVRNRSEGDIGSEYVLKCEILRHLDNLQTTAVIAVACTNVLGNLDPALRRRFETIAQIAPPDELERLQILRGLVKNESPPCGSDLLLRVARATDGFTGADLSAVFRAVAARRFFRLDEVQLATAEDAAALGKVMGPLCESDWREVLSQRQRCLPKQTRSLNVTAAMDKSKE